MIHDGDYCSIVDKDNILSLLDEIEQNIIWFTTYLLHPNIGEFGDDCSFEAFQKET